MLTVGEILKTEREKRGITLKEIEKKIRVREKYLQALEENKWEFFSSKVYITGVIKNYSSFLGLNTDRILAFFRRDYEKKEEVKFKKRISSGYLTPETRKLTLAGIFLTFAFFVIYFGYQFFAFLTPPRLQILEPKKNRFINEQAIKIVGKTQKEATVSVFEDRVFLNKEGIFEYDFPLKKGKNQLIVTVVGANGKKTILKKDYFREK